MKLGFSLITILLVAPAAALAAQDTPRAPIAPPPITSPQAAPATAPASSAASASPTSSTSSAAAELTPEARATAYFDFTVGHYYQLEYEVSSSSDDADQAIDYFKKAFELDPSSDVIGEQLAEMYFQSQRIRDAVLEAQSIIQRDPNNLGARRLLARIYVRTLGDMSDTSGQSDTARLAAEQYTEILRLDPADTDSALWLARLDRLQNKPDDATFCRATRKTKAPSSSSHSSCSINSAAPKRSPCSKAFSPAARRRSSTIC